MAKKWTVESAKSYVTKVQKGKQQTGLTYCSALAFLEKHSNSQSQPKENNNGTAG